MPDERLTGEQIDAVLSKIGRIVLSTMATGIAFGFGLGLLVAWLTR